MEKYQIDFIQLCLRSQVLQFGEFTLKSGRKSPYFFNTGRFNSSAQLAEIGTCFATALQQSEIGYDLLFGPAYKGIPLVCTLALALAATYDIDVPYCFNRKEVKDHGEGGSIVGAPLSGRVCIVDDVITAGTAIRESVELIRASDATVSGVLVLLDRQERGREQLSAIGEIERDLKIPVVSVINLDNIIEYVKSDPSIGQHLPAIQQYRLEYGV